MHVRYRGLDLRKCLFLLFSLLFEVQADARVLLFRDGRSIAFVAGDFAVMPTKEHFMEEAVASILGVSIRSNCFMQLLDDKNEPFLGVLLLLPLHVLEQVNRSLSCKSVENLPECSSMKRTEGSLHEWEVVDLPSWHLKTLPSFRTLHRLFDLPCPRSRHRLLSPIRSSSPVLWR